MDIRHDLEGSSTESEVGSSSDGGRAMPWRDLGGAVHRRRFLWRAWRPAPGHVGFHGCDRRAASRDLVALSSMNNAGMVRSKWPRTSR